MPKKSEKPKKTPQLLRGFKDILPDEQPYWDYVRRSVDAVASTFSFQRIDLPYLEDASLFIRSVGKETDIVEKEMYVFEDKSGETVALRPEGTAGVVRAYIEHGMLNRPQPVKLYYIGPFFRYDRPQAGRYRQFYQFGFEVLGDAHPVIDAQLMMMAYTMFADMGLPVSLQVNSLGSPEARKDYIKALHDYFKTRKNSLPEEDALRLQANPLRLLDSKHPDTQALVQEAPQIVDYLDEESNQHFVKVLEHLDELDIPYVLNPRLVRGLDYYSRTAFEIWPLVSDLPEVPADNSSADAGEATAVADATEKPSAQSALGGGGRYDYLVEELGGQPTSAMGFAIGIERLINELKKRNISIPTLPGPDIFVAQLGDEARKKSLKVFGQLRSAGFRVAESFSKNGLKPQMEQAHKLAVKFTVIIGQKELMDHTILIRDMESGIQETFDAEKMIPELQKRLSKHGVKQNNGSASPAVSVPEQTDADQQKLL
ncbi:MAG: histidine--tRNA ligase [Patescibacteria group bacterium]